MGFGLRRAVTAAAAVVLGLAAAGCVAEGEARPAAGGRIEAVATIGMITDVVARIGGERVHVQGLMGPGVDPHLYKARAGDVRRVARADVIFYNGLHLEASLKLTGGDATIEQMIAATPRGILVTRLWYLREVDPRTILYTGLTRDGTFLIENGKISKAVQNFRFNDSPLFMLNNVEMLGRPQRLAGTEAGGDVVMPALKVRDFNFTSLSEAV